jgi:hypothetical protein
VDVRSAEDVDPIEERLGEQLSTRTIGVVPQGSQVAKDSTASAGVGPTAGVDRARPSS